MKKINIFIMGFLIYLLTGAIANSAQNIDAGHLIHCQSENVALKACIGVTKTGIQRLTHSLLLSQQIDLTGTPISQISITLQNNTVPIYIHAPNSRFDENSYIEFINQDSQEQYYDFNQKQTLKGNRYTDVKVFQLWDNANNKNIKEEVLCGVAYDQSRYAFAQQGCDGDHDSAIDLIRSIGNSNAWWEMDMQTLVSSSYLNISIGMGYPLDSQFAFLRQGYLLLSSYPMADMPLSDMLTVPGVNAIPLRNVWSKYNAITQRYHINVPIPYSYRYIRVQVPDTYYSEVKLYEAAVVAKTYDKVIEVTIDQNVPLGAVVDYVYDYVSLPSNSFLTAPMDQFVEISSVSGALINFDAPSYVQALGVMLPEGDTGSFFIDLNGVQMSAFTDGIYPVSYKGETREYFKVDIDFEFPAGSLNSAENRLSIMGESTSGTGAIRYKNLGWRVPFLIHANNDEYMINQLAADSFQIAGFTSENLHAYRVMDTVVEKLVNIQVFDEAANTFSVRFPGSQEVADYYISTLEATNEPFIQRPMPYTDISSSKAEYLIISHPLFINKLSPLVALRSAHYSVKVINVEDIYAQYGAGQFGADAIKKYIDFAVLNMDTKMVLLVGSDTDDYRNADGWSGFVPSLYTYFNVYNVDVKGMPADGLFRPASLNDIGIGRFPVRNTQELDNLITKTLVYSDMEKIKKAIALTKSVSELTASYYSSYLKSNLPSWSFIQSSSGEYINVDIEGAVSAQSQLIEAINQGTGLVYWLGGHAGYQWPGVLSVADIPDLTNYNLPTVLMHEDAYQHWFTRTDRDTLAEKILTNQAGAVASLGSSELFSGTQYYYKDIFKQDLPIGMAINSMQNENQGYMLLGDPALVINPSNDSVSLIIQPGSQESFESDVINFLIKTTIVGDGTLSYRATGLPAGLSIEAGTGNISGMIETNTAGDYFVTVFVDYNGEEFSASFSWLVKANQKPVIISPGNQSNVEQDNINLSIRSTDADGDLISYSASGLLPGLSIDSVTGDITGILSSGSAGTYAVTVLVEDDRGAASTTDFAWIVTANNKPVIVSPGNQTNLEHDEVSLIISASDAEGDLLSYIATGLPPGLFIDSATGHIIGSLAAGSVGTYVVAVSVTDGYTRASSVVFEWNIEPSAKYNDNNLATDYFDDGNYDAWVIVDEGANQGPSSWSVINGQFVQSSNIHSLGQRLGTYGYFNAMDSFSWRNIEATLSLSSADNDGIGVMFRYTDSNNYYKVEFDLQRNFQTLTKMVDGIQYTLAFEALSASSIYSHGGVLKVQANGDQLQVFVDGVTLFGGAITDDSLISGTIALYSWGNRGSMFDNISVQGDVGEAVNIEYLLTESFDSQNYNNWLVIDEGIYQGPSNWNVSNGRLVQSSNIHSLNQRSGTYAYYGDADSLLWQNYIAAISLSSADNDGIGVMFRYTDSNNYYKVEFDLQRNFQTLTKMVDGIQYTLAFEALSASSIYSQGGVLKVQANGDQLQVFVDGVTLFGGAITDDSLISGTIALYSWGNRGSMFDNISVHGDVGEAVNDVGEDVNIEYLLTESFDSQNYNNWLVIDEGIYQGPSNWNVSNGRLVQSSNIHSLNQRSGTYAYYGDADSLLWQNYVAAISLSSADNDGIGVMFRYTDSNNYYKVEFDLQRNFQTLTKVVNGIQHTLAFEPLSASSIYSQGGVLEVHANDAQLRVFVDGVTLFDGAVTDHSLVSGTIALYSWGNQGSIFSGVVVKKQVRL